MAHGVGCTPHEVVHSIVDRLMDGDAAQRAAFALGDEEEVEFGIADDDGDVRKPPGAEWGIRTKVEGPVEHLIGEGGPDLPQQRLDPSGSFGSVEPLRDADTEAVRQTCPPAGDWEGWGSSQSRRPSAHGSSAMVTRPALESAPAQVSPSGAPSAARGMRCRPAPAAACDIRGPGRSRGRRAGDHQRDAVDVVLAQVQIPAFQRVRIGQDLAAAAGQHIDILLGIEFRPDRRSDQGAHVRFRHLDGGNAQLQFSRAQPRLQRHLVVGGGRPRPAAPPGHPGRLADRALHHLKAAARRRARHHAVGDHAEAHRDGERGEHHDPGIARDMDEVLHRLLPSSRVSPGRTARRGIACPRAVQPV